MLGNAELAAADLLSTTAASVDAVVVERSGPTLAVEIDLHRPSGRLVTYRLTIEAPGTVPAVRETQPDRLPDFCPGRHIVQNGFFCQGFESEDPLPVVDHESARHWWTRLVKYLWLQETTTRLRRWPNRTEWAHGTAAKHQAIAERCAARLSNTIATALSRRELTAIRSKPGFIQVRDQNGPLYSVWIEIRRAATLRQVCFCGSGRVLKTCSDHAQQAVALAFALEDWSRLDQRFWTAFRDKTCCGSLAECPLAIEAVNHNHPPERNAA